MTGIILTEVKNNLGIITLNSPKTLNAISLEMANALLEKLEEWKNNQDIHCVFLQGNDKAFCAGGDVRRLYDTLKNNPEGKLPLNALEFFIREYTLDYTIHTYKKPIVAWGHGIVMGGGIGLLIGASHRIVTEKSKLAMPEITIGLYPDVGGTWFLNRMPHGWGNYFGLTGARMNSADALYLGLADYHLFSQSRESIIEKLASQKWSESVHDNKKLLDTIFKDAETKSDESNATERVDFAKKLSTIKSVSEFSTLLQSCAPSDEWIDLGLQSFKAGSPTSARVIYEQLKRGKNLGLKEVFCSELNLSVHFSMHKDFPEGVRALLVDKDQKPKWNPASLNEVSDQSVETYFTPIWDASEHPLKSFICEAE